MKSFRIGEFAAIGGVSAKTLRYYDEIGLLKPLTRDARSGYRLYTAEQLQDLAIILNLRQFGMSIDEIAAMRARRRRDPSNTRLLNSLRTKAEADIARAASALAMLDAAEHAGTDGLFRIITRFQRPLQVASLRAKLGSYSDVFELETELVRSIPVTAEKLGRGVLWHSCADSGTLEAEAFVAVKGSQRESSKITLRELPPLRTATIYCVNAHEPAERGYDDLRTWMNLQGHALAGPKCEVEHGNTLEISFPFEIASA